MRQVGVQGGCFDVPQESIEVVVIFEAVFKGDVVQEMFVMQLTADCNSIYTSC